MQKQQFTKSMSHSSLPRDIFWGGGDKSMFSSIWLIWKVVTIRFSHCKQCLIVTSFDIVSWTSLFFNTIFASVNPNFCFLLYLNVKKVILLLNANNFYKLLLFLIKAIFTWHASIISRLLLFQLFYIFLRGSYTVNRLLKIYCQYV